MEEELLQMAIEEVKLGRKTKWGYLPTIIATDRGSIQARYYHAPQAKKAIIFVGGVSGGFDSPAKNLYVKLAEELQLRKISSLRIQYRHPTDMVESILDVVSGIAFMQSVGVTQIALIGHSFGGAVVLQAAAASELVQSVVTLATQAYGTESVGTLEGKSLLFLHGTEDEVLPAQCSSYAFELAQQPKELVLLENTGHILNESAQEVYTIVRDWLLEELQ